MALVMIAYKLKLLIKADDRSLRMKLAWELTFLLLWQEVTLAVTTVLLYVLFEKSEWWFF
jgi:hypothetical protein